MFPIYNNSAGCVCLSRKLKVAEGKESALARHLASGGLEYADHNCKATFTSERQRKTTRCKTDPVPRGAMRCLAFRFFLNPAL